MPSCSKRGLESFMPNLSCHRMGGVALQRHQGDLNESLLKMVPQSQDGYAINLPVQLLEHKRPHANTHTETIIWNHKSRGHVRGFHFVHTCVPSPRRLKPPDGRSGCSTAATHTETGRSASAQEGFVQFLFFFSLSISLSLFRVSQIWITTSWQRGIFKSHRQAMPLKKNQQKTKKIQKNPGLIRSALVPPNYMCLKSNRKKSGLS